MSILNKKKNKINKNTNKNKKYIHFYKQKQLGKWLNLKLHY